ncbi:hypothetical protein KAT59_01955, partial [Candidatus Bipolaricaulota bacterium]|nr:hypothetical protein [Candidatus Bipolaricaulota bacterium]
SNSLSEKAWLFMSDVEAGLFSKMKQHGSPLLELPATISRGSSTGNDQIFMLIGTPTPGQYTTTDGTKIRIEQGILRTPLFATDFTRYWFMPKSGKAIIFPYRKHDSKFEVLSEAEIKSNFPQTFQYLYSHKKELEKRKQYKSWYSFSAPRNLVAHDAAQMIVPLLANKGRLTELPENREDYCVMASGGFSIAIADDRNLSPGYVLGLLNSSLLFWYLQTISNRFRGGWITCTKQYVGKLPIRTINFSDPDDKAHHDRLVELVESMLKLHKDLQASRIGHEKSFIQRQIDATDKQIDQLVYELYGLTDEEIRIVEEATKGVSDPKGLTPEAHMSTIFHALIRLLISGRPIS